MLGFLSNATYTESLGFQQLISGYGWLVRKGQSYVGKSPELTYESGGFTMEKAPRTAVGIMKDYTMVLLEIDGEEDINAGPDLFEFAELMVSYGVESAINIDGGGSSTVVYDGDVIDEPTCNEICEREVASITCVRPTVSI